MDNSSSQYELPLSGTTIFTLLYTIMVLFILKQLCSWASPPDSNDTIFSFANGNKKTLDMAAKKCLKATQSRYKAQGNYVTAMGDISGFMKSELYEELINECMALIEFRILADKRLSALRWTGSQIFTQAVITVNSGFMFKSLKENESKDGGLRERVMLALDGFADLKKDLDAVVQTAAVAKYSKPNPKKE